MGGEPCPTRVLRPVGEADLYSQCECDALSLDTGINAAAVHVVVRPSGIRALCMAQCTLGSGHSMGPRLWRIVWWNRKGLVIRWPSSVSLMMIVFKKPSGAKEPYTCRSRFSAPIYEM
jgi:hypothetical protein